VDSWSVDYVRLAPDGEMLREPFCYRDERTVKTKRPRTRSSLPSTCTSARARYPLNLNTVYQLMADPAAGIDSRAPWVMFPEFVLYWLSGRRVAEYTNATHTGLVNLKTGTWDAELFETAGPAGRSRAAIGADGHGAGADHGTAGALDAFRATQIIAPATHDTASAIAGIATDLSSAAYISSGTWSLVGTITQTPVTTRHAFDAGYTNIGAAGGGLLFHSLINSMWVLKQCMDAWAAAGAALAHRGDRPKGCCMQCRDGRARYGCADADARHRYAATHQQRADAAGIRCHSRRGWQRAAVCADDL
jgi:rhamnulokinase